ncbi:MAG TPA: hypothetical protein VF527_08030 [Pyrinomonadaceae bacterium]|jgi:hypothetical protein
MKHFNALFKHLLLACAVCALAASVCGAQTPANNSGQTGTSEKTAAPAAAEKPADKTSPVEEELSKTPTGKTVAKFFAAFNSGDLKTMRAFHESTGGDPENADKDFDFYERTGGLKPHSLTSSATDKIAVLVQAKKDERWITFHFTVDTKEPHGITSISVRPATAPPAK